MITVCEKKTKKQSYLTEKLTLCCYLFMMEELGVVGLLGLVILMLLTLNPYLILGTSSIFVLEVRKLFFFFLFQ